MSCHRHEDPPEEIKVGVALGVCDMPAVPIYERDRLLVVEVSSTKEGPCGDGLEARHELTSALALQSGFQAREIVAPGDNPGLCAVRPPQRP